VYGPVFTAFSYLLASVSIAVSVFSYKAIAAVASLVLVGVVWRCARLRGLDPVRSAALVGLNPLLVLYGVGGGHNDLLMLLAVAGALYAVLAGRPRSGGALAMVAIGVKLTAGLLLPFVVANGGPRRGRGRRDLLLGAAVGFALIAALSFAVFGSGAFHLLATVRQSQSEGDWKSIPGVISGRLGMATVGHLAGYVLAAAFVIVSAWLVWRVWRQTIDWIDGAAWSTLALLIASSSLLPWYVAWMLPLAALARDRRLWLVAVAMTGIVQGIQLLGYIPHNVL
jgi:alpha-1,6-mannosyltransferase